MDIQKIRELSLQYAQGHPPKQKQGKPRKHKTPDSTYYTHIRSLEWKAFRKQILAERGRKCERCGVTRGPMHVHHVNYKNFGHENPEDVKVLCERCHGKKHPQYGKGPDGFLNWFAWSLKHNDKRL